jgi:ribA/ribD-fused uncharacterized protein
MSSFHEQLEKFYKGRKSNPDKFTYDNEGNLVEKEKGQVIKTIPMPNYRPLTFEEYDDIENKRKIKIAEAEKVFENAREQLRRAYETPNIPMSRLIEFNRKVSEADAKLQQVRFPIRFVNNINKVSPEQDTSKKFKKGSETGIEVRELIFSDKNEKRKIPYPVYSLRTFPYTLEDYYVRIGQPAKKTVKTLAEIKEYNGPSVIVFSDDKEDYNYLTLKWPVEIEYNNTRYSFVYQAIMAEMAKYFNDQNNLQKIMITDDPNEIEYSYKNIPGDEDINEVKWNDYMNTLLYNINLEKFKQYPDIGNKLIETVNAPLGYYQADDNVLGIGISPEDKNVTDPGKWTGQNLVGKNLMMIRDKLKQDKIQETQQPIKKIASIKKPKKPVAL